MSDSAKSFISGGFGGTCLVLAGHPLDTVKVRLQTSSEYTGMMDCFKKTIARDGFKGVYRGITAPILSVTPIFATYFWGFDLGKKIARSFEGTAPDEKLSVAGTCFAGGFSAFPGTAAMVPGDRVKVILQIQGQSEAPPKYSGAFDCARQILKEDGIKGLYKGTALTLMRDVPGSVAYYAAYEIIRDGISKDKDVLNPLAIIFAGGMAGIFNWLVAVPPDVLKSRYQTAPEGTYPGGFRQVLKELVQKDGVGSLYKGLTPALARAFPANAACFMGMEVSRKALDKLF